VLGQVAVEDEATTFQQLTEPGMGA